MQRDQDEALAINALDDVRQRSPADPMDCRQQSINDGIPCHDDSFRSDAFAQQPAPVLLRWREVKTRHHIRDLSIDLFGKRLEYVVGPDPASTCPTLTPR